MGKQGATTLVFVMFGVLVAVALLQRNSLGESATYKKIWGAGLWSTGLSVFADFAPELVGPMAILVLIAAVARDNGAIGILIGNKPAGKKSTSGQTAPSGGAKS